MFVPTLILPRSEMHDTRTRASGHTIWRTRPVQLIDSNVNIKTV